MSKKRFYACGFSAQNRSWRTGVTGSNYFVSEDPSKEEKIILRQCKEKFPKKEGWANHDVHITAVPTEELREFLALIGG